MVAIVRYTVIMQYADIAANSYNCSIHAATSFSLRLIGDALLYLSFEEPHYSVNKDHLRTLHMAHKLCRARLERQRVKYKNIYDQHRRTNVSLEKGDVVLHC